MGHLLTMSFESVMPREEFGCACLRGAVADRMAPFTFNDTMMEFELRMPPGGITCLYYCPFCGEPTPKSLRGSFFSDADEAEEARLNLLMSGIGSETEMRAKFGVPDWELHTLRFRDFSACVEIVAQFRGEENGVWYQPKPNPEARDFRSRRFFDEGADGRPIHAADEGGKRGESCTCEHLTDYVADPDCSLYFRPDSRVFELEVSSWSRVVRHCWFCGGKAPDRLGTPRMLYPDREEMARINEAIQRVHTPDDALKEFGPLHRDVRQVRYYNLSTMAVVSGTTVDGVWRGLNCESKYIGPKRVEKSHRS
jgi:hypothetical protein